MQSDGVDLATIWCCNFLNINYFRNTGRRTAVVLLIQIRDYGCDESISDRKIDTNNDNLTLKQSKKLQNKAL